MWRIFVFIGNGTKQNLIQMQETMVHRGPDGQGNFFQLGISLGYNRQTIVDLNTGE